MTNDRHALETSQRKSRFFSAAKRVTRCGVKASVRAVLIAAAYLSRPFVARAQDFSFPTGTAGEAAAVDGAMPALAEQIIAAYKEESRATLIDNLFRSQIVAGR